MPSGRPLAYRHYTYTELEEGITLEPPEDAVVAYVHAEYGAVRWLNDETPTKSEGFPLDTSWHDSFDIDLGRLSFVAAEKDAQLSVYYFGS